MKKNIISIIIAVLLIFGGVFLPFMSGFMKDLVQVVNFYNFIEVICIHSFSLSIGIILIILGIKLWLNYAYNHILEPYDDVLYLLEKENNKYTFIDKVGHIVLKYDDNYIEKGYYEVKRTKTVVREIVSKTEKTFSLPHVKYGYSKYICLTMGNYDGRFVLPFIWLCLVQSLAMTVTHSLVERKMYIVLSLFLAYLLTFDAFYKMKRCVDKKDIEDRDAKDKIKKEEKKLIKNVNKYSILFLIFLPLTIYSFIRLVNAFNDPSGSSLLLFVFFLFPFFWTLNSITYLLNKPEVNKVIDNFSILVTLAILLAMSIDFIFIGIQRIGTEWIFFAITFHIIVMAFIILKFKRYIYERKKDRKEKVL